MKKLLKSLALGVAMCFGLFAFTACGGGQFSQANVNTSGNYVECTKTVRNEETGENEEVAYTNQDKRAELANTTDIEALQENFGYKTTIVCAGAGINFNTTFIVTYDESGAQNALGGKMNLVASEQGFRFSLSTELYAPGDGYVYLNTTTALGGFSEQQKIKSAFGFENAINELTYNYNFNKDVIQTFLNNFAQDGVTLEKAEIAGQTKYHITLAAGELENSGNFDTNLYMVFDAEGNFVGAKLEGKISMAGGFSDGFSGDLGGISFEGSSTIELEYSVSVVPFDGEIVVPGDLNTYTSEGYIF